MIMVDKAMAEETGGVEIPRRGNLLHLSFSCFIDEPPTQQRTDWVFSRFDT